MLPENIVDIENKESVINIRCKMPITYKVIYFVFIGLLSLCGLITTISIGVSMSQMGGGYNYAMVFSTALPLVIGFTCSGLLLAGYFLHRHLIKKCFANITKNRIEGVNVVLFKTKRYSYPISDIMEVEQYTFLDVNKIVVAVKPKNECGLYLKAIYRPSTITMKGNRIVFRHVEDSIKVSKEIIEQFAEN